MEKMKYDNNWVQDFVKKEKEEKFLFFWGHRPLENGNIGKSCFSQWFVKAFTHEDIVYQTAEHWMMAEKARLFNDKKTELKILTSNTAEEAKKMGREVKNFTPEVWDAHKFEIVKLEVVNTSSC